MLVISIELSVSRHSLGSTALWFFACVSYQVSFGLLTLLDSPLFKIYVFGQKAEGQLARPFKKQGLMTTLSGPMEGLAAKVSSDPWTAGKFGEDLGSASCEA